MNWFIKLVFITIFSDSIRVHQTTEWRQKTKFLFTNILYDFLTLPNLGQQLQHTHNVRLESEF